MTMTNPGCILSERQRTMEQKKHLLQLGGYHLISRRGGGRDIGMDQNIFFNMIQLMVIFFQLYG